MPKTISLSTKLGAIGAVLLLMALASIGLTLWVTWQLEGGAAAVNEAGRMRMQTWRLAQTLPSQDGQRLQDQLAQFEQTLSLLRTVMFRAPCWYPRTCARSKPLPKCSKTGNSCAHLGRTARRRQPRRCLRRPKSSWRASTPLSPPSKPSSRAGPRCSTPSSS
jgi:hypothetical protein